MIGDILKELREDRGLTQNDLADKLRLSRTSISGYENNINDPNLDTLVQLADFFNVSTDYLLRRTKESSMNDNSAKSEFLHKFNSLVEQYNISRDK